MLVRLAKTEEEALLAHAILRENVQMVGFVTRGNVVKKFQQREVAVALSSKGAVLGCVCFHVRRDRVATIYEIAVSKNAPARGVGSAMVVWLRRHLSAAGAIAIKLKCTEDNIIANKFYGKVGFVRTNEERGKRRRLIVWRVELGGFLGRS